MFFKNNFSLQEGSVWLNAASEGPLPRRSALALQEAIVWKSSPHLLTLEKFASVPLELKKSLGRLLNVPYRDVILGNSASYGLHILANGIRWRNGDEILLMRNDFPTDILPWLALEQKGVAVRQLAGLGRVLSPEDIKNHISSSTRVLCLPHVHTFSGLKLDLPAISEVCAQKSVRLVVNVSQSAGAEILDFAKCPVDAIVGAGYKWLCGPYGTGYCWIRPDWRDTLDYNQAYWISTMSDDQLKSEDVLFLSDAAGARKFDVFGTANFFNFVPFRASIDYFLEVGLDRVHRHIQEWIGGFIKGLHDQHYQLISSKPLEHRSALVVISHINSSLNAEIHRDLTSKGIYTALWKNNIRISPHVYNDQNDLKKVLEVLNRF